jgi:hypothetical protein
LFLSDDYEPYTTDNDIALVKLKSPVQLNDRIDTACLPQTQVTTGTVCYVTGYEYTEHKQITEPLNSSQKKRYYLS